MNLNVDQLFAPDRAMRLRKTISRNIDIFVIILSFLAFCSVLYDLGFTQYTSSGERPGTFYSFCLVNIFIALLCRYLLNRSRPRMSTRVSDILVLSILFLVIFVRFTFLHTYLENYQLISILNDPFFIYFIFGICCKLGTKLS